MEKKDFMIIAAAILFLATFLWFFNSSSQLLTPRKEPASQTRVIVPVIKSKKSSFKTLAGIPLLAPTPSKFKSVKVNATTSFIAAIKKYEIRRMEELEQKFKKSNRSRFKKYLNSKISEAKSLVDKGKYYIAVSKLRKLLLEQRSIPKEELIEILKLLVISYKELGEERKAKVVAYKYYSLLAKYAKNMKQRRMYKNMASKLKLELKR